MTPSKPILALCLGLALCPAPAPAQGEAARTNLTEQVAQAARLATLCREAFRANEAAILAGTCQEAGGVVFQRAEAPIRADTALSLRNARGRARLHAGADLLGRAAPERVEALADPPGVRRRRAAAARMAGLTYVHDARQGDVWVAVAALPKASWERLRRRLATPPPAGKPDNTPAP